MQTLPMIIRIKTSLFFICSFLFYTCVNKNEREINLTGSGAKQWFVKKRYGVIFEHPKEMYIFYSNGKCEFYSIWDGQKINAPFGDVEVEKTWEIKQDSLITILSDDYKIINLKEDFFEIAQFKNFRDSILMISDTTYHQ